MIKTTFLGALCMALCAITIAQPPVKNTLPLDPDVATGTLPNGMRYFLMHNAKPEHRAEFRLAVDAGSTEENDAQQGFAHLCEHMAFNGTTHFAHNDLVNYLESIGTKFGADLNAYTSFDETVYMLQIPTDKQELLDKGLQVLDDWAHGQLFDSVEVEKERGVVYEEWRLGQGANERMRRQYWPVIYAGSRYADRLPIGKPDIILHGAQKELRDFYKTWYRPDLEAIIIVGDIDVKAMEKKIKDEFSQVPARTNVKLLQQWDVPVTKGLSVKVASDKESPYNIVEMTYRMPEFHVRTPEDYRASLVYQLAADLLTSRLKELSMGNTPSFLYAGAGWGNDVRHETTLQTYAIVNADKIADGTAKLVTENTRAARYGFTATELQREKAALTTQMETQYAERDKTESRQLVGQLVDYYLNDEAYVGIAKEDALYKSYIGTITLQEINDWVKKIVGNTDGADLIAMCTLKDGVTLPTDADLKNVYTTASTNTDIKAYTDNTSNKPLVGKLLPEGKVESTTENKQYGITDITLSNGAHVRLKPTDFKNDQVLFQAVSPGGESQYSDAESRLVSLAVDMQKECGFGDFDAITLDKMLHGKEVNVDAATTQTQDIMYGNCVPKELETLMQLIYLHFTAPRTDDSAAMAYIKRDKELASSRLNDPSFCFNDSTSQALYNYNVRYKSFTPAEYDNMQPAALAKYYKQRFASPSDFTFTFVGNFTVKELTPLLEKYIASIPAGKKETYGALPGIVSGTMDKTYHKGSEPRATVELIFNSPFVYDRTHRYEMNALMKVMEIKLRESLREDKSGVYGVRVYPVLQHFPQSSAQVRITFSCGPENVDMLEKAAIDVVRDVQKNGCDSTDLSKTKETFLRDRETQLKENRFWLQVLSNSAVDNENVNELADYTKWVNSLTGAPYKQWAAMYMNEATLKKFVLMPVK